MSYICPVCGYPELEEDPYAGGEPSYEICPACGFQFGFTDEAQGFSLESWRALWIERGMTWAFAATEDVPTDWDPRAHLRDLEASPPDADEAHTS
ncbi:hypothetical protein N866_19150 [Actinotalea ferrariae CF5-4]|uniref:Uncharacterized protein n=1 Tax=Actinotalea ferrariae CF5-4 TaxID=948458 RepID=A0A021VX42_9CELL|nr:hypothetical protein N866_19150 [Actinotalea ferrariae CF5-4]